LSTGHLPFIPHPNPLPRGEGIDQIVATNCSTPFSLGGKGWDRGIIF